MYAAACTGDKKTVLRLLGYGTRLPSDPKNAREELSSWGGDSLHGAMLTAQTDCALVLLKQGKFDLNSPALYTKNTPVHIACIQSRGGSHCDIIRAVLELQKSESLYKENSVLDKKNVNGLQPLHHACKSGDEKLVKLLVDSGANVNSTTDKSYGCYFPLHFAVQHDNKPDICTILLRAGANIDCEDAYGRTPLHVASLNSSKRCVEVLIVNGADQSLRNKRGSLPIGFIEETFEKETKTENKD